MPQTTRKDTAAMSDTHAREQTAIRSIGFSNPTNDDRATWANAALEAFTATQGEAYADEPLEDRVGDLICDLLHLVCRDGVGESNPNYIAPYALLERAQANFEEEESEEADDEDGEEEDRLCATCEAMQMDGRIIHEPDCETGIEWEPKA